MTLITIDLAYPYLDTPFLFLIDPTPALSTTYH